MNPQQKKNLELLAVIASEIRPEEFNMKRIKHACGTPACLFGHYVADPRQNEFGFDPAPSYHLWASADLLDKNGKIEKENIGYASLEVQQHFGVGADDLDELFGSPEDVSGYDDDEDYCDVEEEEAHSRLARTCRTPKQAAAYIRRFIVRNS